jgi:hypothetical protein
LNITWGSSTTLTPAAIANLARYDINTSSLPEGRVHYIDSNVRLTNPQGPASNGNHALIIDTGLDPDNVVYVRLGSSGTFYWKSSTDNTCKVAVLTVGNGSVVFYLPSGVTYGHRGGVFVGPYNLAVAPNAPANWLSCTRLDKLTYAINAQTEAAWIKGLLEPGTGRLRINVTDTGDWGIARRNHSLVLNMNNFLVHNGTNTITLQNRSFFVGSIYAPRTTVTAINGGGDNLLHFGSIAGQTVNINVMDHVIAALPGGGLNRAPGPDPGDREPLPPGGGGPPNRTPSDGLPEITEPVPPDNLHPPGVPTFTPPQPPREDSNLDSEGVGSWVQM